MTHLSNNKKYVPQCNILSLLSPFPVPQLYSKNIIEQFARYLLEISEQSSTNVLLLTRNWMHHGTQGTFVYSRGARSPGETTSTSLAVTLGAIHTQITSSCHPGPKVLKYILVN
jgi:hypothetical protein